MWLLNFIKKCLVSGGLKEIRYATAPELAIKPKTWSVSVQTEELYINTSIPSEV